MKDIAIAWKVYGWLKKLIVGYEWGRNFLIRWKARGNLGIIRLMHLDAIHHIRALNFNLDKATGSEHEFERLEVMLDGIRNVFCDFLEIKEEQTLHCTLKIFDHDDDNSVYTLARSSDRTQYWSGRELRTGRKHCHSVAENSAFASLMGVSDRKSNWGPDLYSCFLCEDLNNQSRYDSSGEDWDKHYSSTMVFPIRFYNKRTDSLIMFGFLTFDAKSNVFGNLVDADIFNVGKRADYEKALTESALFHIGALISDNLSTFLALRLDNPMPDSVQLGGSQGILTHDSTEIEDETR